MKKYLILMLAVAAALVSCGKDTLALETVQATPITFNLSANHPDATKAVKSGWESGDAIFVFFTGAAAPKHLKMTYDGTSWTSTEYNAATQTAGALGLKNGDTGTMRAVFLPFGSDATVSADGTSFTFSETYYAYYLTATLDYTVADNKVSGAFNMVIPDDYVQFFVEDAAAIDGGYTLGTDAVIPVGVASIDKDGNVVETSDKVAGNDMTGYAYSEGYLFSGKLNGSYTYGGYYFAKTKTADNSRADYFVSGKTLASHSAVKLPANDNVYTSTVNSTGKWIPVGSGITVTLYKILDAGTAGESMGPLDKWYTCNYGQSVPEALGSLYSFDAANALGVSLPTKAQFQMIANSSNCSYTWLTVHGQQGAVFKAGRGFLFLPGHHSAGAGFYWSSTEDGSKDAWYFFLGYDVISGHRTYEYTVRPIQN
ncbi:MAG: hypothetical protein II071_04820 [Bacteroidales bacterium]|nr:hypothetical protein [Bacteroidales bacterium]